MSKTRALIAAIFVGGGLSPLSALASDGQANFANLSTQSTDQPVYDHSFAKQWEANPREGFPTLSPANLNAMKTAIKLYTEIVDRGGWKQIPDVQMQMGSGGAAGGLLRERLAMVEQTSTSRPRLPSTWRSPPLTFSARWVSLAPVPSRT